MLQKFKPTGDRLLVQRAVAEETTASGIIIPDTVKEKERAQEGRVIAVGAGRRDASGALIPMEVRVGDHVYFGKYAGTEAGKDDNGIEYLVIREEEVLGVIEQ